MDLQQLLQFLQQLQQSGGNMQQGFPSNTRPAQAIAAGMPMPAQQMPQANPYAANPNAAPMRTPETWNDAYGRKWYGASKPTDMAAWQANNDRILGPQFRQPQPGAQPQAQQQAAPQMTNAHMPSMAASQQMTTSYRPAKPVLAGQAQTPVQGFLAGYPGRQQ